MPNLLYVETAVLHSGLSSSERIELVKRFNDPKDNLKILIIMHSVSTQGVNLDAIHTTEYTTVMNSVHERKVDIYIYIYGKLGTFSKTVNETLETKRIIAIFETRPSSQDNNSKGPMKVKKKVYSYVPSLVGY